MAAASPIVSHVPGRLRLRAPELRRRGRNGEVCAALAAWDGVLSAEGNPATGGILLRYDAARVAPAAIQARLAEMFAPISDEADEDDILFETPANGLSLWDLNRYAKWGMLGALGGSLAALAVGKKLHAALGAAHVAFLLVHLANHRGRLLD